MPIPLIVVGLIIAGGLLAAGGVVVIVCLSGKNVVFIGMKGSGKTTAVRGFQAVSNKKTEWKAGNVPTEPTLDDSKEHDVLGFKACVDTSGAQQLKRSWSEKIKNADWVFYFFDISRLDEVLETAHDKRRYYKYVKADLNDIAGTCQKENKPVLVVATHTDKEYDKEKAKRYVEEILAELEVLSKHGYVAGSLLDYASVTQLCHLIEEKIKK